MGFRHGYAYHGMELNEVAEMIASLHRCGCHSWRKGSYSFLRVLTRAVAEKRKISYPFHSIPSLQYTFAKIVPH